MKYISIQNPLYRKIKIKKNNKKKRLQSYRTCEILMKKFMSCGVSVRKITIFYKVLVFRFYDHREGM